MHRLLREVEVAEIISNLTISNLRPAYCKSVLVKCENVIVYTFPREFGFRVFEIPCAALVFSYRCNKARVLPSKK